MLHFDLNRVQGATVFFVGLIAMTLPVILLFIATAKEKKLQAQNKHDDY